MSRKKKILTGIVLFLIAVAFILNHYANSLINDFVGKKLDALILKQKNEYAISYGEINSNYLFRKIEITDISVEPIIKDSLHAEFMFQLQNVVLKFSSYTKVLKDNALNIDLLKLVKPKLVYTISKNKKEKNKKKSNFDLFKAIFVKRMEIDNGTIQLEQELADKNDTLKISGKINFNLDSLTYNFSKGKIENNFKIGNLEMTVFQLDTIEIKGYRYKLGRFEYSSYNKILQLEDLYLVNLLSLEEFKRVTKFNQPWLNLGLKSIRFKVDLNKISNKKIDISSILFEGINLNLYADNTLPKKDTSNLSIRDFIRKIDFPLNIDTVRFVDLDCDINIKNKLVKNLDQFKFNDLSLRILNINSDTINYTSGNKLTASILSLNTNNDTLFSMDFNYGILQGEDTYFLKGKLRDIPYRTLKSFIENRINLNLHSGQINQADFSFIDRNDTIRGKLFMDISDVSIRDLDLEAPNIGVDVRGDINRLTFAGDIKREYGKKGVFVIDSLKVQQPVISWVWIGG